MFDSFMQAWNTGSFALPVLIVTEPILGVPFLIWMLITAGIELLILIKCRAGFAKWILPILSGIGILACDISMRVITGWDRLVPLFGYGIFTYQLAVSLLCILIVVLIRRKKSN